MIKISITQNSATGKFAGPGRIDLDHSDQVHPIEIAALWQSIKTGGFEHQAKVLLEQFCSKNGFDSHDLLQ